MLRALLRSTRVVVAFLLAAATAAADGTWPRQLETARGPLTIYQPQPEKFDGNVLTGRAAAALLEAGKTEPTFGVFWFIGRVDTDREAGTALLRDIQVTQVRWPDSKEAEERDIAAFLTELMPKTGVPLSLERLKASLATAEIEQASLAGLKHDPPKIVVVEELAELLQYDGEPRTLPIPNTEFEQVANAAFAVVRDKGSGTYYLCGGKIWYSARDPKGPWAPLDSAPADIAKLVPPDTTSGPVPAKPPRIVVATEPTELIATDGPPAWKPLGTGELMYVANTETPVVRELSTGQVYVLVSGRWYRAESLAGTWTVVRPDQLPAAFKDIPPASDLGSVRVAVAGTPEAEDAMLDAHVPQTAAIDRSKAKLEVQYDGEPQFKRIEGTGVEYAVNTSSQVLRIDNKYYACDQGVWFVAEKATGAWAVADSVPMTEVKKIPPSEPVYNVTHVTVYESTPTVVYVGYTPGYMWSYPWYGCPVYGTGWYYPPYWGAVYYPRPVTYGLHVGYNPYTGWHFGFSYSTGFMHVGVTFGGGYGGYYRPGYPPGGYYRPPCHYPPGGYRPPHYHPGYRPGTPRPTPYAGGAAGQRPSTAQLPSNNIYRQGGNKERVAPSSMQRDAGLNKVDGVAKGPNNVYADRNGNVHRQTSQGWQSRDQGQWKGAAPAARPSSPSAGRSPTQAPANLQRDQRARQQGAQRSTQAHPQRSGGGRHR